MHDKEDKKVRVSGRDAPNSRAGTQGGDAQRPGLGAGGGDAPPSNTASQSYGDAGGFRVLLVGVDSLYVSYAGELSSSVEFELATRKQLAQHRNRCG